ncbi:MULTISPECIES: non-homologous end joining protein Ku [Streptomyces]|uniref:Non-homologous end joining protein Ku n=1 Tax=Streptomyces xanthochromogenes TaxID=67384 RepID=A0ABQ3AWS2_9ACTN|nr:Ku protein [Streptomyces xanthochromogenes]MYV89643.1 Ku protein [Streptomyces sp. SID1034]GGY69256.1 non-homologous end joining protein Ku [Streptomyces xanthochromogenes]
MRSIWNGAISFGLVSIPIKVVNATENHSISFRQIHTADGGRVRYRKVCELDGEELSQDEIGKAYEDADGSMIPITDADLASLPLPTAKTIEIVAFVAADTIDPLQMDAAYYLSANGVPAAKPYTLLREALKRSKKVAIAKFALRGRERLGMLRVVDDVIAMHGLLWPDEIRASDEAAPEADVSVREAELDLADALMDTLGEVDMATLHDDYRTAVEELIAAKADGAVAPAPEAPAAKGGKVIDLMAALENSVKAAKASRGEGGESGAAADGDVAEVTELSSRKSGGRKSAPAKKTASKTAAKSTAAAKKTTGTKAAQGKKSTASKTGTAKTAAKKSAAASPKSTGAKKSTATTAKKTAAKKTTPRKRASA